MMLEFGFQNKPLKRSIHNNLNIGELENDLFKETTHEGDNKKSNQPFTHWD